MNLISRTPLVAMAFMIGALATAQTHFSKDGRVEKIGNPKNGLNAQDSAFIKDAAAGNTFEVRSSQIALKNGKSPFVKQFAKEMIVDHSAAFEELKQVARRKGKIVSKTLPPKLQATVERLERLRGAAFDSAYQAAQKAAHAETTAKFQKEIRTGRDGDVKGYAIKTLPTVEMHAKMLAMKKTMSGHTRM